jgi:predicted xylose isomerase-like sugar epimerase
MTVARRHEGKGVQQLAEDVAHAEATVGAVMEFGEVTMRRPSKAEGLVDVADGGRQIAQESLALSCRARI